MIKALFENTSAPVSRLPWIDYAKGIAIVLVVYRHIMIGLERSGLDVNNAYVIANEVVFTFRMPLFFLLAGFFIRKSIGKRSSGEFIFTKFDTILYPYLIWAFVQVTIQILLSSFTNSSRTAMDYLYILVHPRAIDQFWFLYAIFNTTILYLLFYRLLKENNLLIFVLSIAMHYASTWVHEIDLLHDALYYFMFLCLGDVTGKFVMDKKNQPIFSSFILTVVILPAFIFSQWLWFNYELNVYLFAIVALVGCLFMVNVAFILEKYNTFKALRYVGFYSLYVYLLHVIVSAGARIVLTKVFGLHNTHILLIIGIILGVFVPIMIYNLCMRYNFWFLFNIRKPARLSSASASV